MPLVVMLHGCQQSVDEFAQGTRMNLLADKHGFAVLYPEQSLRAHAHGCWHWYEDTDRAGRGEVNAVASLVDALVDEHGFDASRVYVAGLSAGAGLASLLHCTIRIVSRRWRCIQPGARRGDFGHYGDGRDAARRAPEPGGGRRRAGRCRRVSGHAGAGRPGDGDHVVAPKNADQLTVQFMRLNGLADSRGALRGGERVEKRDAGAQITDVCRDGEPVVRLCHVKGADHAWAGGDEAVPFHAAVGPDASAMIWAFSKPSAALWRPNDAPSDRRWLKTRVFLKFGKTLVKEPLDCEINHVPAEPPLPDADQERRKGLERARRRVPTEATDIYDLEFRMRKIDREAAMNRPYTFGSR